MKFLAAKGHALKLLGLSLVILPMLLEVFFASYINTRLLGLIGIVSKLSGLGVVIYSVFVIENEKTGKSGDNWVSIILDSLGFISGSLFVVLVVSSIAMNILLLTTAFLFWLSGFISLLVAVYRIYSVKTY